MFRFVCTLLLLAPITIDSARILGIFPMPSISHQVVFRALTLELARRGHELVIVTPDLALPKDRPPDNVTEIDVSFAYNRFKDLVIRKKHLYQRGVVIGVEINLDPESYIPLIDLFVDIVEHPEVRKIVTDKSQHFDVIIGEAFLNYHLIFSKIFNAPTILVSSFHGVPEYYEAVGAVAYHPTLYPSLFRDEFDNNNIINKLKHIKFEYNYYTSRKILEYYENEQLKKNYGPNAPTVRDLRNNIDMLFINSHPIFCNNRPVPPNTVYVGPLHLQPLKAMPEELKTYLDNSKNGVIYVSLGTNVKTSIMDKELIESFRDTFEALPYDILWKFDEGTLSGVSKNVRIQKWFPQRDLLVHPNIKLFIMQGGLQSTDEAIDATVPLVGIPMMGDQFYNVQKYVELGIGVKVDAVTLTKETLLNGINTVLNNDSYKQNIKKLKQIMNDQETSSLDRAVWWTEYIIRHGGGKHLKSPAANILWSEYFLADVIVAVVSAIVVALILVSLLVKFLVAKLFKGTKLKRS